MGAILAGYSIRMRVIARDRSPFVRTRLSERVKNGSIPARAAPPLTLKGRPRGVDIEANAFEEEPGCIRSTLVICNRVREAAMLGSLPPYLDAIPHPAACPRHGVSSQRGDETTRLTPIPNSRVGFRSVLNHRCATSAFVAQRSSQRATRKSTRAANRS